MKSRSFLVLFIGFLIHQIPSFAITQQEPIPRVFSSNAPANSTKISTEFSTPVVHEGSDLSEDQIQEVLNFWFGNLSNSMFYPEEKVNLWLNSNSDYSRQIVVLFEKDVHRALLGQLNDWRSTPKGRLALIILLDQYQRHIFPGKPQAFASEAMAKGLVLEGLQMGADKKLLPIERAFFYMPLQRFEDLNLQNLSVDLYTQLLKDSPVSIRPKIDVFLKQAQRNRQIIARFKRFPGRNRILGRESTPEETIFLNQRILHYQAH